MARRTRVGTGATRAVTEQIGQSYMGMQVHRKDSAVSMFHARVLASAGAFLRRGVVLGAFIEQRFNSRVWVGRRLAAGLRASLHLGFVY